MSRNINFRMLINIMKTRSETMFKVFILSLTVLFLLVPVLSQNGTVDLKVNVFEDNPTTMPIFYRLSILTNMRGQIYIKEQVTKDGVLYYTNTSYLDVETDNEEYDRSLTFTKEPGKYVVLVEGSLNNYTTESTDMFQILDNSQSKNESGAIIKRISQPSLVIIILLIIGFLILLKDYSELNRGS